ncbi:hypothetical protein AB0I81_04360 [Nonomuraea sp. NPDC050404]|uniref:hypothetical protein n=1 Tax=Nonomuraea sp. NPDC050404 TaxID=3155783 RepID=UPI0033DF2A2C
MTSYEEEETPQQQQLQAVAQDPAKDHSLPMFQVTGNANGKQTATKAIVTTAEIEGRARIDRTEVGAEPGDGLGWIQTMFRAHLQADYYTAGGVYVESHIKETNKPHIDGDGNGFWYSDPMPYGGGDPIMGSVFSDSPQHSVLLTSPKGGHLVRFAASWEFGCWLVTRTPNGRVKFLHHQDWTASFHAEYRNGAVEVSHDDVHLGDSGPGSGSLHPLMDGPPASEFLDDPGLWTDAGGERLHKDGADLT